MADNDRSGSKNPRKKSTNSKDDDVNTSSASNAASMSVSGTDNNPSTGADSTIRTGKRQRSSLNVAAKSNETTSSRGDRVSGNNNADNDLQQSTFQQHESMNLQSSLQQETVLNNQLQLAQLGSLLSNLQAGQYMSPAATQLILANQLQQQAGSNTNFLQQSMTALPSNQQQQQQQQLSYLLQQQVLRMGLAQSLGVQFPSTNPNAASSTVSSNTNSSMLLPSSQLQLESVYPSTNDATSTRFPSTMQPNATSSDIAASVHHSINSSTTSTNHGLGDSTSVTAISQQNEASGCLTGRPPILLYISCDNDSLSEYQCLVRKHIELFEAVLEDVQSNAQGRNRPIVLGQVGIRCTHCKVVPPRHRARGAIYYPAKLQGIYQAAQNLAVAHLGEHCHIVPDDVRQNLARLRERKSSAGGGKRYWADAVRVLGVYEDRDGLRFENRLGQGGDATS